jgi:hypothetical protein
VTTYDGRTVLRGAAVIAGALLGGLAGGVWWFLATLTFAVEGPTHEMHVDAAWGLGGAAVAVLVLGLLAARALRAPVWSLVPVVAVSVVLAASAAYQLAI